MEALDVARPVGGETEREPFLIDAVRGLEHGAAEAFLGRGVGFAHLLPDDLLHLALRGAGDEGLGLQARLGPPEHGARRRPVLAGAVRADNGDAPVFHEGFEHLGLL
ncbi:MAG: hypothetical protein OXL97_12805 [Chloroflexota bacterium]|nr:hypothetical protein [Chloroflexota bacterium]MDE2885081.1 hypothetical protein [Chloroflexota bacterium]